MKTISAGSRTILDYQAVCSAVALSGFNITEVISGGAPGVDTLGEQWAAEHGVPVHRMPARWDLHGKSAGFKRNYEMALYVAKPWPAGGLIAVWDGVSRGTFHMIKTARLQGLEVFVNLVQKKY